MDTSLRVRVALLVLLLAGALVALLAVNAAMEHDEQLARMRAAVGDLARLAAEQQDDNIDEARVLIDVLRHVAAIREADPDQCSQLLRKVADDHPLIGRLQVASISGQVLCHSVPVPPSHQIGDRAYFREALATSDPVVSDFLHDRVTGNPTLVVARRIEAPDRLVTGVLAAGLDLSWFGRVSGRISGQAGHVVLIVDRAGTIVSRFPDPERWVGRRFAEHPLTVTMLAQPEGVLEARGYDGTQRIYGFVELPGTAAHIAVGIDRRVAVGLPERRLFWSMVVSALVALGATAASLFGVELVVVRPVRAIAAAAERLGAGDLAARSRAAAPPELLAVQDAFNTMADRLAALVTQDTLTGLSNRRAFDAHLELELARSRREHTSLSLLMVDVDRFKQFNDRYGHPAGDDCLKAVAAVLKHAARRPEDMAARYGGEEFAVVLPGASVEQAIAVGVDACDRLRALRLPHEHGVGGIVTMSIGIADTASAAIVDAATLIARADAALYRAKQDGRDRCMVAERDGVGTDSSSAPMPMSQASE